MVKASHVLADGMALVQLTAALLEAPVAESGAPTWQPEPSPGLASLVTIELAARVGQIAGALGQSVLLATDPDVVAGAARTVLGFAGRALRPDPGRGPRPSLAGRVGTRRDLAWGRLPLDEVRRVAHAQGVTVNDVVLALAAGAIAEHQEAHPGTARARDPHVVVPVSVHGSSPGEEVHNEFAVVLTELPVGVDAPLERLRRIHADLVQRKATASTSLGGRLFGLAGLVPPRFLRVAGRMVLDHQGVFDLAVTNLVGPRKTLSLRGARMVEVYPLVTGTGNIATIIGVLSYADTLGVCVTVDADVVPDPEVLVAGFARGLDALVAVSDGTS